MGEKALEVWIYGIKAAIITENDHHKLFLTHTQDAINGYGLGNVLLSLSMLITDTRLGNGVTRPFLDGLLPEGAAREQIATRFNLRPQDTYGLITELGGDCAGAMVIQSVGSPPPSAPECTLDAELINDEQLVFLLNNLKTAPLGIDQGSVKRIRTSLAGVQEKLLLTKLPDGSWGRPINGTPSTHILKPANKSLANIVENEFFCMKFAKNLGLNTAEVEKTTIGGRPILVIKRYDRIAGTDGTVERIHQEDFTQIASFYPEQKYQEDGGSSLRQLADKISPFDKQTLLDLLKGVTFNTIIANGDAHAKNFSILHERSGKIRLAPLYDLITTTPYADTHLAMYIDNVRQFSQLSGNRIINEGVSWRLPRAEVENIVNDLIAQAPLALAETYDEIPDVPEEIFGAVKAQLSYLANGNKLSGIYRRKGKLTKTGIVPPQLS